MLNRRKAMIGWLVYTAAKPIAKKAVTSQAKKKPAAKKGGAGKVAARMVTLAAVAGGVLFWRHTRSRDDEEPLT